MVNLGDLLKPQACGQTVLPDRSVLKGQKLVENALKNKGFSCYYSNQFSRHWLSLLKSQMCSIKSPFCSSALFEDVSGISPSITATASCTCMLCC